MGWIRPQGATGVGGFQADGTVVVAGRGFSIGWDQALVAQHSRARPQVLVYVPH